MGLTEKFGTEELGAVLLPAEDVKELGGPSGHEMCRWKLELPGVGKVAIGCQKTAGHHRLIRSEAMQDHADYDTGTGWDRLGRFWEI